MYKKGSVVFRDVCHAFPAIPCGHKLTQSQYELVEPGSHHTEHETESLGQPVVQSKTQTEKDKKKRQKARVLVEHLDIIKDDFWDRRPWLLSNKPGKARKET